MFRWGLLVALTLATAALVWSAAFNPRIVFFTSGPGRWVVYPLRRATGVIQSMMLPAVFRRSLVLQNRPASAELLWRGYRQGVIRINGQIVSTNDPADWKRVIQLNVASWLHPGTNQIEAIMAASFGPPAVSLKLQFAAVSLESDEQWEVSLAGADWRHAREAWKCPPPGIGNEIYGAEATGDSLRQCAGSLALLALASVAGAALLLWALRRWNRLLERPLWLLLACLWAGLLLHNSNIVPLQAGFDAPDHLSYVNYLLVHKTMPSPNEGFEMFQPPLYHACAALVLGLLHLTTDEMRGMAALRIFNVLVAIANLWLIFASLRLLFPGQWKKQMLGLAIGAFMPMYVCLLHYPTNETFAATLVTAALYLCLRLLKDPVVTPARCAAIGAALGAAMLAKASALLAVPLISGVIAARLISQKERRFAVWFTTLGLALEICLALCGWHYWNIWRHFGSPLTGNWDPAIAVPWWQYPGYHTAHDYTTFGAALQRPLFSSFDGFWDSIYSTMWGDGLCGGPPLLFQRTPWNYQWMDIGFVLALMPSLLILTGFAGAVADCCRQPRLSWVLLLSISFCYGWAVIYMTLKLPFYSQAKSFYGLPALLPLCCFAVRGWDFWTARGFLRQPILALLALWLAVVYASFWVLPHALGTEISAAAAEFNFGDMRRAADHCRKALALDPGSGAAQVILAEIESAHSRNDLAAQKMEAFLSTHPGDPIAESHGAAYATAIGRMAEAIAWSSNAVQVAPEDPFAAEVWCALELRQRDYPVAARAARAALSLDPVKPSTHLHLGIALLHLGQTNQAIAQFQMAATGYPPSPEARQWLKALQTPQPQK